MENLFHLQYLIYGFNTSSQNLAIWQVILAWKITSSKIQDGGPDRPMEVYALWELSVDSFLARDSMLSALYAIANPSVHHTGGSVENGWS